jgi:hypothetical protein
MVYPLKSIVFCFAYFSLLGNLSAQKILRKNETDAFRLGEKLTFRVHYGVFEAGEAVLTIKNTYDTLGGRLCYHVVGIGTTASGVDPFFKVRDRYESIIDKQALIPWLFIRRVDEGGYKINENVIFSHYHNTATSEKGTFPIPDNIQDLVSAFYYARSLDFSNVKEGEVFPIKAFLDNEVIPLNLKFIGRDKVKTKQGTFRCLKFRPLLQEGRIFKEQEDMTIWISDDKNKIPIRVQAEILVGSIKMDIKEYEGLNNPPAIINK